MKRKPGVAETRRYIGVYFRCCQVYQRIYRRVEETKYSGFCPRCLRQVVVPVATHGTSDRIFVAE